MQLYESEDFLAETVGRFLAAGLRTGDAAVVIATEEHRHAFSAAVATCGVDAEHAVRCRQLIMLDAAATLRAFMTPAGPDAGRFAATIGTVLDGAAGDGRPVRAYGEMVALLWDRGAVASAIGLEQLWNDLATERDFSLLCAYPLDLFADPGAARDFARMCGVPPLWWTPDGWAIWPGVEDVCRCRRSRRIRRSSRMRPCGCCVAAAGRSRSWPRSSAFRRSRFATGRRSAMSTRAARRA